MNHKITTYSKSVKFGGGKIKGARKWFAGNNLQKFQNMPLCNFRDIDKLKLIFHEIIFWTAMMILLTLLKILHADRDQVVLMVFLNRQAKLFLRNKKSDPQDTVNS